MNEALRPERTFEEKKTAFFSEFAASHASSFRPHFLKGETLGKEERWRNVSEHCLVSGVVADILSRELGLSKDEKNKIVQAAILHDWFKKQELKEVFEGTLKRGDLSLVELDEIKRKDAEALREMGISEDVIKLTGANIPATAEGPQTLPEKILWYVDIIVSNTDIVSFRQRLENAKRGWDEKGKVDSFRAARDKAIGEAYRIRYKGKTLHEMQEEIGEKIEPEIAKKMGYKGDPVNLPDYLKRKIEEEISKYQ